MRGFNHLPWISGLFSGFQSDAYKKFQTRSHERISPVKIHKGVTVSAAWELSPLNIVHVEGQNAMQSVSPSGSNPWDDHRTRKRSITSLDILVFVTLYELVCPLSDTNFCSRNRIHFQTQPRYVVCKNALFGCSFEQENWKCVWNRGYPRHLSAEVTIGVLFERLSPRSRSLLWAGIYPGWVFTIAWYVFSLGRYLPWVCLFPWVIIWLLGQMVAYHSPISTCFL